LFYNEAINYIKNIERAGSDYGIERMRELLILLNNPDENLKFVHIAGTNGKGSTTANITSILKESGYKVGTYNSPAVFKYNERWSINGEVISDDKVAKYLTIVKDTIEKEQKIRKFQPTAFEIETAVAFLLFNDEACDICVLETGLGGRWDATNVIFNKELAVITKIGLDHCAILGNTLSEIASEKAAIIKDEVVTCNQEKDVLNEINKVSNKVFVVNPGKSISHNINYQEFLFEGETYKTSLLGDHQIENACISIKACEVLSKKFNKITLNTIKKGLEKAIWHARFEVIKDGDKFGIDLCNHLLIFDGSHNPQGASTLAGCIEKYFDSKVYFVLGILKDKDYEGIVKLLMPYAKGVTCITPPSIRALNNKDLKMVIDKYNIPCILGGNIKDSVGSALKDNDIVILCGSLTLFENL